MDKEELTTKISQVILQFESQKGSLKWSVSEVSRESQVTRSLIYYHFGRKKNELLLLSLERMMNILFTFKNEDLKIKERLKRALAYLKEDPSPFIVWYLYRLQDNEFGQYISTIEANLSRFIVFDDYVKSLVLHKP